MMKRRLYRDRLDDALRRAKAAGKVLYYDREYGAVEVEPARVDEGGRVVVEERDVVRAYREKWRRERDPGGNEGGAQ